MLIALNRVDAYMLARLLGRPSSSSRA